MGKHNSRPPDPFADMREWQDHRYDPGYFLGGRIHPILKAGRPNRYGWVLLVIGAFGFVLIFSLPRGQNLWWQYVIAAAYFIVYFLAGVKLLRRGAGNSVRSTSHHRHRRTRKGHP
jgi:hypothetical protein